MKRIIILTLCFLMLISTASSAKTLEFTMGSNIMYESDGGIHKTELENAPYTSNGRTMVPVRIISEKFGAEVIWNGETQEVTIKKGDNTIVLTIGSAEAYVNSSACTLDVLPEEKNGRTMVPLRFISEALGMDVGYVKSTQQVLISDEEPILTVNGINLTVEDYRSFLAALGYTPGSGGEKEAVDYATVTLVQFYAAASNLVANAESDLSEVKRMYDANGEGIYETALFAPLAQFLENDIMITDTVNSYIDPTELEKAAKAYYADNFVKAKHILITSETRGKDEAKKEAEAILAKINKGEDFDEIMFEVSEDPGMFQYPEGYVFTYGEMVPEFEAAAFDLDTGKISELVETSYGYHIIKREELPSLDENMAVSIMNMLASEQYEKAIDDSVEISNIALYKTTDEIIEMLK